jgi:uncharacterized protein
MPDRGKRGRLVDWRGGGIEMPGDGKIDFGRHLMVPARDRVGLATDMWRPDGAGPFPILLGCTPSTNPRPAAPSAQSGWRHRVCTPRLPPPALEVSERGQDGHDTLAWLMTQPLRDGRPDWHFRPVRWGTHAGGAWLPRPVQPGGSISRLRGFSNAYRIGIRHDGAFDLKQATWACNNALASAGNPAVKAGLQAQDIKAGSHAWHCTAATLR